MELKQTITKCGKCGKKLKVDTVDVFKKNGSNVASQSVLYVAACPRCRRTIYSDSLEEMMR